MKFMRRPAGYSSLDNRQNEDILREPKVDPVENKLAQYDNGLIMLAGWRTLDTQNNS
jgi:hypothetical protein